MKGLPEMSGSKATKAGVRVVGAGVVTRARVVGSALPARVLDAPVESLRWSALFDAPYPGFRRLDALSRCVSIAAEAAGVSVSIRAEVRRDTALVLCTGYGCLASDMRFAASLAPGAMLQPAVFPYTLPSTCLGDLAIRHGLRGPLLCLTASEGRAAVALTEAHALIQLGDARAALVCFGEGLEDGPLEGVAARAEMGCLLLALEGEAVLDEAELSSASDPIEWLADALAAEGAGR